MKGHDGFNHCLLCFREISKSRSSLNLKPSITVCAYIKYFGFGQSTSSLMVTHTVQQRVAWLFVVTSRWPVAVNDGRCMWYYWCCHYINQWSCLSTLRYCCFWRRWNVGFWEASPLGAVFVLALVVKHNRTQSAILGGHRNLSFLQDPYAKGLFRDISQAWVCLFPTIRVKTYWIVFWNTPVAKITGGTFALHCLTHACRAQGKIMLWAAFLCFLMMLLVGKVILLHQYISCGCQLTTLCKKAIVCWVRLVLYRSCSRCSDSLTELQVKDIIQI